MVIALKKIMTKFCEITSKFMSKRAAVDSDDNQKPTRILGNDVEDE